MKEVGAGFAQAVSPTASAAPARRSLRGHRRRPPPSSTIGLDTIARPRVKPARRGRVGTRSPGGEPAAMRHAPPKRRPLPTGAPRARATLLCDAAVETGDGGAMAAAERITLGPLHNPVRGLLHGSAALASLAV